MFTLFTRRMCVTLGISAVGLAAMGGSALATSYNAYGKDYQTKVVNGTEVAVASDGTAIWNSVPSAPGDPESDTPVIVPNDDPADPGTGAP